MVLFFVWIFLVIFVLFWVFLFGFGFLFSLILVSDFKKGHCPTVTNIALCCGSARHLYPRFSDAYFS